MKRVLSETRTHTTTSIKKIRELVKRVEHDPTKNTESRKQFLDMLQWEGSHIQNDYRKQLEHTIVEYNDIFARHRLDIGISNNLKVKLTPKDKHRKCHFGVTEKKFLEGLLRHKE